MPITAGFAATQYYNSQDCTGGNVLAAPDLDRALPPARKAWRSPSSIPTPGTDHGGWWHWLISDLPSDSRELKAGAGGVISLPAGSGAIPERFRHGGLWRPLPAGRRNPHLCRHRFMP
ncbi:MAG: hypothetical protein WDN06_21005 [Asticcacaulis sp.]